MGYIEIDGTGVHNKEVERLGMHNGGYSVGGCNEWMKGVGVHNDRLGVQSGLCSLEGGSCKEWMRKPGTQGNAGKKLIFLLCNIYNVFWWKLLREW